MIYHLILLSPSSFYDGDKLTLLADFLKINKDQL